MTSQKLLQFMKYLIKNIRFNKQLNQLERNQNINCQIMKKPNQKLMIQNNNNKIAQKQKKRIMKTLRGGQQGMMRRQRKSKKIENCKECMICHEIFNKAQEFTLQEINQF
ncbi:unnamed protein product [Paramecium primaurelia]|uniref:Uncharacterized protein n=1 Tax=Paramecium primaurelia TaxID=5886 RepID=A0A8S1KMW0_PARPR|nr:unnamed protein product [Paramecium primaurelia]